MSTSVTATLFDGPGNSYDWWALSKVGTPDGYYLQWKYVPSGQSSDTWQVTMPGTADDYEFRLYENNGYNRLATSSTVTVGSGSPPTIDLSAVSVFTGDTVDVTVAGGAGSASSILPATQSFTYDANGNRASINENGTNYAYTNQASSNRLTSTTGPTAKTYSYDSAGNVLSDGLHSYGYDDRGRLTTIDSTAATYTHNGQGQRVKKVVASPSLTALFVYDEGGNLIGEYDALGNATQEHIWFNGAPVALISGTNIHYVHTDHLGTPRVITDGSTVIWRWESDPFGSTAAQEDPDGDTTLVTYNLRFPGQYYDSETGLHYNYFRDYDPATGKYIESDPIGLNGGANTFRYAESSPTLFTDPRGLQAVPIYPFPPPPAVAPGGSIYQHDSPANQEAGAALAQACESLWEWNKLFTPVVLEIMTPWYADGWWGASAEPPEDAYDPDGAKAPGKPGEEEGFEDPKGGESWVPNPNGRGNGWLDADGNVWVPTGPGGEAHGGPHWDVQSPGRGRRHVNVYPGGRRR